MPGLAGPGSFDAGDIVESEGETGMVLVVGKPEIREIMNESRGEDGTAVEAVGSGTRGNPFN
jgi:hypothetical protein